MIVTGTTSNSLSEDLALARRLAVIGSELALEYLKRGFQTEIKPDGSPVTDADVAVERARREIIGRDRPTDAILGEELGASGASNRCWVLDPIDGTKQFISGRPQWGTHVALQIDGRVALGVITRPVRGESFWASRGAGAYRSELSAAASGERLRVSEETDLKAARVTTWGRASEAVLTLLKERSRWLVADADAVLDLARGKLEAVIECGGKAWDHAPAVVIVEEAGGRYSDPDGGQRIDHEQAWYTTAGIHAPLVSLLRSARA
jgi:histidinol-phosphatase